jgi:uncharacterized ion transporter superfamily protein YfcC
VSKIIYPSKQLINFKILLIVIIVSSVLVFGKYQSCQYKINNNKECNLELQREIKGVVENNYMDNDINVKAFVIRFTTGEKYINPIYLKNLNGIISNGDSFYKKPGTFSFEIYVNRTTNLKIIIDSCNCNKL